VNYGPVWADVLVYNLELGYAGTFDFLVRLPESDDRLCLCDLKTCAYKAWPVAIQAAQLQAAAYALAWNCQHKVLEADLIASIHVSPYGLQIITTEGQGLIDLQQQFRQRLHTFGSRLSEQTCDCDDWVFGDA